MALSTREVNLLAGYFAGRSLPDLAHTTGYDEHAVAGIVQRLGYNRRAAGELVRQHRAGLDVSIPSLEERRGPAAPAPTAAVAVAPARSAAADSAPAVETPRQPDPRPAVDAPVPAAAVGEDDADEEVTADASPAAVTSIEQAAAVPSTTAAALDDLAALVEQVLDRALFFAVRWYCPACVDWPLDPGACAVCKAPLQPVYLATIPRSIA